MREVFETRKDGEAEGTEPCRTATDLTPRPPSLTGKGEQERRD